MNMTHRLSLFLLIALLPLSQGQAETVVLDLQQAVDRALEVDPRITEKERHVDLARAQLREVRGADGWSLYMNTFLGFAPKVRGGVFETTNADGKKSIGLASDAFDIDGLSPWYYLEMRLVKPLHTFGKITHYSKAAAGNIQVKRGDIQLARAQTRMDIAKAYYGYLAARDSRRLLDDTLDKLQASLDLLQGWLDEGEGDAKQSNLFALQTGTALLKRYQVEAQGYERIALEGLRILTGLGANDNVQVADKRLKPLPLPEGSLKELTARAMTRRPEVRQLAAGLDARREYMLAKRSESLPNLYAGLAGSVSYAPGREDLNDVSIYDPFYYAGMTPVIGLKWDWNSGRQPAQVAQAKAELDATLALRDQARMGIPFQVAEQYHTVHSHHEMVQRLYEGSRSGRRWLISVYADFEAGVEETDNLVAAFQGYVLAYGDYLRVVNAYNMHVERLRVVTGDIP
ncbi:MAG: TolC family protein [Gammaproteobacteria bacterium]|nr:TolC family protein [Gammaproteobacteria bacterium]MCF6362666.1 TolC family protein [Gammaproteobacteria bacterium]